jgi:uncharacterized membrane protein YfcA
MVTLLSGLLIGLVMALTGAGGGILAVPLLVAATSASLAQAGPAALAAVGLAAAFGAALGLKAGTVRYRAALLMAAAGMLAAPLGVWGAARLGNRWLGLAFALVLLLVAARTWRQATRTGQARAPRHVPCVRDGASGRFAWNRACARALALAGALAGLLSGLLGVGGGFVLVPALQRHTDLPMASTVPTSLAVIALVSAAGVAASAAAGALAWQIALPFTAGALAGMLAGRALAAHLAGARLQAGFALVTALAACGMIGKALA